MNSISQINLVIPPSESQFQKNIPVTYATCAITKKSISELAIQNLQNGYSHCLAFVRDVQGKERLYDAAALIPHLAKNQRWKWLAPETNVQIKKIYYFIIHPSSDPVNTSEELNYQLVKKIKADTIGNSQTYEDFWFCNNLASALNKDSPFSFYSFISLFRYYEKEVNHSLSLLKYQCVQSISRHYGKGVSILVCYLFLHHPRSRLLECYLFSLIDYHVFNEFLPIESLMEFIDNKKEKLFEEQSFEYSLYIEETLQKALQSLSKKCDASKCLEILISSLKKDRIPFDEFQKLAECKTPNISNFSKAILCTIKDLYGHSLEGISYEQYIHDLINYDPEWNIGKAFQALIHPPQSIDKLDHLSQNSHNPLFLSLLGDFYHRSNIFGSTWGEPENISFFALMHARSNNLAFNVFSSRTFPQEPKTCIDLMERNFIVSNDYLLAQEISKIAMRYGIENKEEEAYLKGINIGMSIFRHRREHNRFFPLVSYYALEELTPFPLHPLQMNIAITILNDAIERNPSDYFPSIVLASYQIRKGSLANAKKSYNILENLLKQHPANLYILFNMVRYQLRIAVTDDDIEFIEDWLEKIQTLIEKTTIPEIEARRFFLLKALWLLHPLCRPPETEYLNNLSLAHLNNAIEYLEKAFEGMNAPHIKLLIKNMDDFLNYTDDGYLIDYTSIEPIVDDLLGRSLN